MPGKGFAESVERAGADVTEYDADRADDEFDRRLLPGMAVAAVMIVRRGRWRGIGKKISHEGKAELSCSVRHLSKGNQGNAATPQTAAPYHGSQGHAMRPEG